MITQILEKITQMFSMMFLICVIGFLISVIKGGTFVTPYKGNNCLEANCLLELERNQAKITLPTFTSVVVAGREGKI